MGGYEVSRLYGVWFFAEGEWFLSFCDATALTTGAKHWHRLKAVFYVFVSVPPSIYPRNRGMLNEKKSIHIGEDVDA